MHRLWIGFLFAFALGAHCPQFPSLPECPAPPPVVAPPPTPTPGPTPTPPPEPPGPVTTRLLLVVTEVFLEAVTGSDVVTSSPFPIIFLGEGLYWKTDVKTADGGSWLSTLPTQGLDDVDLRVRANIANLKPGNYTATVSVVAPGAINTPGTFRVTLRVRDPIPATMRASVANLAFTAREGDSGNPASQKIALRMEGESKPDWTASATSLNGGTWLTVSPASGKGDGELSVTARLSDLPSGVYVGRINLESPSSSNRSLQVPVSFTISRQRSSLSASGVVNAATLQPGAIAPGQLITIGGERLGPRLGVAAKPNEATNRLATSLAGTRILFDGIPGAVLFSSVNQVNVQVPFEIAGKTSVKVIVEAAGFDPSTPVEVSVAQVSPGLFSIDGVRAAALNQDSTLNAVTSPVAVGEIIQLFFTGQGLTTPRVETGELAPSVAPFAQPDNEIAIFIGGVRSEVLFAGLLPGSVGLLQVNARIPATVAPSPNVAVGARFSTVSMMDIRQIAVKAATPSAPVE